MDIKQAYDLYRLMLKIRLVEEAVVREYPAQQIRTPVHLYVGEEAIAAGVTIHLSDADYVVSNHRSHGHCLAKGLDLEAFFKELYGKRGGCSNGWGGSMHLCDMSKGIAGTSAIVAGGIPIGAGLALKQQYKNEKNVTVIYFGDGAVDEGVFWETVNFAGLKNLPVLFVMEDNGFASQTGSAQRHAYDDITSIVGRFAVATDEVDGNDALAVAEKAGATIARIRQGQGPGFLRCSTYRWYGHVGVDDDTPTGYRSPDEVQLWREKCPVQRLEKYLALNDPTGAGPQCADIRAGLAAQIEDALLRAKEAEYALD
jgi:TPP-dependent pyruvate/acetoin dehydrogenase alpha subunit